MVFEQSLELSDTETRRRLELEAVDEVVDCLEAKNLPTLLVFDEIGHDIVPMREKTSVFLNDLHGISFLICSPFIKTDWKVGRRIRLSPLFDLGFDGFKQLIRLCL